MDLKKITRYALWAAGVGVLLVVVIGLLAPPPPDVAQEAASTAASEPSAFGRWLISPITELKIWHALVILWFHAAITSR